MPNKLTIRIVTVPTDDPNVSQTVTKILVEENDHVTFENKAGADASVVFENGSPLCKGNRPENPIPIGAGKTEMRKVCVSAGEFKYTTTVTNALPEDPILIVERALIQVNPINTTQPDRGPIVFPEDWIPLLAGAVIGFAVGYFGGRRRASRPS